MSSMIFFHTLRFSYSPHPTSHILHLGVTKISRRFFFTWAIPCCTLTHYQLGSLSVLLWLTDMREELARLLDGLTGGVRFDNADPRWAAGLLVD